MGMSAVGDGDSAAPHTLFSSSSCKYCVMFLKELNKHSMMALFNVIDIEKTAFDVSKVRSVPTIIVDNNRALTGRDAFAWLLHRISNEVSGVEGTSSHFSFIEGDGSGYECASSMSFAHISDIKEAAPEVADTAGTVDVQTAFDRLKAERL